MARRFSGIEMQRAESAEDGRVVILNAGGDAEETGLEIADEEDQVFAFERVSRDLGQRADECDRERGRTAEAGAARGVGARRDLQAGELIHVGFRREILSEKRARLYCVGCNHVRRDGELPAMTLDLG